MARVAEHVNQGAVTFRVPPENERGPLAVLPGLVKVPYLDVQRSDRGPIRHGAAQQQRRERRRPNRAPI